MAVRRDIAVNRRRALLLTTVPSSCWPVPELGAGCDDPGAAKRDRVEMAQNGRMTPARLEPPSPAATRQLVDAVVALSEDPGPDNLERYLAASRALEDSRGMPPHSRIEKETVQ